MLYLLSTAVRLARIPVKSSIVPRFLMVKLRLAVSPRTASSNIISEISMVGSTSSTAWYVEKLGMVKTNWLLALLTTVQLPVGQRTAGWVLKPASYKIAGLAKDFLMVIVALLPDNPVAVAVSTATFPLLMVITWSKSKMSVRSTGLLNTIFP